MECTRKNGYWNLNIVGMVKESTDDCGTNVIQLNDHECKYDMTQSPSPMNEENKSQP